LTVKTTLDTELQRTAERVVAEYLEREGAAAGVGQAALVALSPTGEVRAMVGGRSYGLSQFNRAVQALRQPGSAFKPVIYLAGLEKGLRPDMRILDAPIEIAGYAPRNFDDTYRGEITAIEALSDSVNSASVRVLEYVGVDETVDLARRLGITSDLRPDLTLALGSSEVTVLELTAAYGAFVGNGHAVWPHGIGAVVAEEGEMLYKRSGDGPAEMVRPWHVWELNRMLEQVMVTGTGRGARLDRPAAGKTGTSQDYRDAWFVGYTADYIVGVWVGNDDGTPMRGVSGGGLPARIWRDFMLTAHRGLPPRPLPGIETIPVAADEPKSGVGGFFSRLFGN
ncbi:MAG: carboxypeptidase, partial [Inquilinus sp.]|nr:carboxypeptidase [Inquilinus sp.]